MDVALTLAIQVCHDNGRVVIERDTAVDADSQLSAIAHGRPPEIDECKRLSALLRASYERRRD